MTTTDRPSGAPPLPTTASVVTTGSLRWLGWVWGVTAVVFVVVMAIIRAAGYDLENSLWQGAGAGWQRWVVFAAGVTTVPVYGPLLISNGITRQQLSWSAVVALTMVAIIGGAFITAGYAGEHALFGWYNWLHVLDDRTVVEPGALALAAVESCTILAAYFVSGWLVGIGFYKWGPPLGIPLIAPSAAPLVASEVLVGTGSGFNTFGGLRTFTGPPAGLGIIGAIVVIGLACIIAFAYTRTVALKD
jgi:hypothetical protein